MSACPQSVSEIKPFTIGSKGTFIGGKSKDRSWVLTFISNYDVLWRNRIEPSDFAQKKAGQNLCVNLGIPYGQGRGSVEMKQLPQGTQVLEAFKCCPFVRVNTIPCRSASFGASERWHYWKNPPKYGFQIDCDHCDEETVNKVLAFGQWIGANGASWREKAPGDWSVNVVFHFSDYMYKEQAKATIDEVLELLELEDGVKADDPKGCKNDIIKNIWAIRTLKETYSMGLRLSHKHFDEIGPRGGLKERHYWFVTEDSTPMLFDPILNSNVVVWNENCIGSWFSFRGRIEDEISKREKEGGEEKSVEMKQVAPSPEFKDIQENMTTPESFTPPSKEKKTPFDHFSNWQTSKHDYVSVFSWPEIVTLVRSNESGVLEQKNWDAFKDIMGRYEQEALKEGVSSQSFAQEKDNWIERQFKRLIKWGPEYWVTKCPKAEFGTYKRIAGKILRTAQLAYEQNLGDERVKAAWESVKDDVRIKDSFYIQTILKKEVKSRATLWRYKKDMEWPVFVHKIKEVLKGVEGHPCTKGEELLFRILESLIGEGQMGAMAEKEAERRGESVEMKHSPKKNTYIDRDSLKELKRIKEEGVIHIESDFDPEVELAVALDNMRSCNERCLYDEAEMWRQRAVAFGYEPPQWRKDLVADLRSKIDILLGKKPEVIPEPEEAPKPQQGFRGTFADIKAKLDKMKRAGNV